MKKIWHILISYIGAYLFCAGSLSFVFKVIGTYFISETQNSYYIATYLLSALISFIFVIKTYHPVKK